MLQVRAATRQDPPLPPVQEENQESSWFILRTLKGAAQKVASAVSDFPNIFHKTVKNLPRIHKKLIYLHVKEAALRIAKTKVPKTIDLSNCRVSDLLDTSDMLRIAGDDGLNSSSSSVASSPRSTGSQENNALEDSSNSDSVDKKEDAPFKYDDYKIKNPFLICEEELNRLDHILIISIFSGVMRIIMAVVQVFVAIAQCYKRKPIFGVKENHFKHAGLNFMRAIVALVPIFGNLALVLRDNAQRRCTYNNEITRDSVRRVFDKNNNNLGNHLKKVPHKDTDLTVTGFPGIVSHFVNNVGKLFSSAILAQGA